MLRKEKVGRVREERKNVQSDCARVQNVHREQERERASDVVNGCKLIAVMWILIPINQGQCGLRCHLYMAGKRQDGALIWETHTHTYWHTHMCTNTQTYTHTTILIKHPNLSNLYVEQEI